MRSREGLGPRPRGAGRRWVLPLVGLLLLPALVAAGPPLDASAPRPGATAPTTDRICSGPALRPGLGIRGRTPDLPGLSAAQSDAARAIATAGARLKVPARAQAIALMTAWSASGFDTDERPGGLFHASEPARSEGAESEGTGEMSLREFYTALTDVDGWQSLPPGIAAHRATGDPDPYRYEGFWEPAVRLLGALAADPTVAPEHAVSTGARAAPRCAPVSANGIGFPLPAGTAYRLTPSGQRAVADSPDVLGRGGAEFRAHCGTAVLASVAGSVVVEREAGSGAGPWRIGIRNRAAGVSVWYHHVTSPAVRDGQSVGAGARIARVGGLGATETCSLGVAVWERPGAKKPEQPVHSTRWLRTRATPQARLVPGKQNGPNQKGPKQKGRPATTFRVASFNVLGAHLTGPGGSKGQYGPGGERMGRGIELLESSQVGIVVLNEFEGPQHAAFRADPDWQVLRATGNSRLRSGDVNGNAIAWRSDQWQLTGVEDEVTVPWQVTLHMPVVRLRHRETKRQLLVMGVHNPASTRKQGNQQGARDRARAAELAAVRRLTSKHDLPILVMGDMNERDAVFCHFTGSGDLVAAAGGSTGGTCRPPRYGGVDWIFGSPTLVFRDFSVDRSTLGGISDHPLVTSTVRIPAG